MPEAMNESIKEEFKETKEEVQEYINARIDLVKLNAAESLSKVLSGFIVKMTIFFILFFAILFVSLAFASWLDAWLGVSGVGYFIVGGMYVLFILVFWAMRQVLIERPIIQSIVELFFPATQDYDKK
jgi:hypothetical protein